MGRRVLSGEHHAAADDAFWLCVSSAGVSCWLPLVRSRRPLLAWLELHSFSTMGCKDSKLAQYAEQGTLVFDVVQCIHVTHSSHSIEETKGGGEAGVIAALKTKRGVIVAEKLDMTAAYEKKTYPKTEAACTMISASLQNRFFIYNELSTVEQKEMVDAMERKEYTKGHAIIEQGMLVHLLLFFSLSEMLLEGAPGDAMYVVESGSWDVFVDGAKVTTIGSRYTLP